MRIAFFVNSIEGETPNYSTTHLALAALNRGHDICYLTPSDFVLRPDDSLVARALTLPASNYKKAETLFKDLQGDGASVETLNVAEIDVLLLRNDPSEDATGRPWAAHVGTVFGRLAAARGVIVLNDPDGLTRAQNKLYFQDFPASVRPETLIAKSIEEIRKFIDQQKKGVILKPLQGSGGKNVFKIASARDANIKQIFEAVSEEGYLIAQSFMPEASQGDVRFFLMNGQPLQRDGKYAAFRRAPAEGEIRSNIHAGGSAVAIEVTDTMLTIAETVRPKLIQDGMFLVGLDIVGDKLLEINVFTPGGLNNLSQMYGVDFALSVIEALERKVDIRKGYGGTLSNRELATF
ncbi:glutathione synthase [Devosia psychrophila]|uniref:Glutathione synthetase n=1 Tax=Devosia psychrophila TaxID=728005 RepID=A0A0F5PU10_9HYPH|nr:glutathione synthase [Devosia psychrophila]KKC31891.1 glutathione synthetase [Devosia psychrophila]SFD42021.1 glutathione synthase [Devosia psychrophila]